ncbi:biotin--[acetyl-CoA-carboxylase] ligase [Flavihumibacter profundi]|uniref:biotin--[acetyl-CoA-carboxylase] ligase n=1 Tax=Flavihumibacter profundi TaxID=2716883 RepID=UPI001CC63744|nr:biotin--[acetyl-CoA-carboxylase] ligase [Flavihumibacter profundi]MBZ5858633.1 biotin--[acetyl-CoA-carboxylase] ligase [Flavihumibacter profundi]
MPVHHIGQRIILLESVDSSNNYAMALAHQRQTRHGEVFFTLEQTAGKGQMGRQWLSRKGENIMLSIVLETSVLSPAAIFPLSMAISLGCYDFLLQHIGEDASIKWPNDLYWRDRKAGGILIENNWLGPLWQFAIVGIGLNVNQVVFDSGAKRPVSLKQITGKTLDLMEEVQRLCGFLEIRWQQLVSGNTEAIKAEYNQALYGRGKKVMLKYQKQEISTIIREVNAMGELVTQDTIDRNFRFGEVEWM